MNQSSVHIFPEIARALLAAQQDIKPIAKDSVNPHFKNKYASLDAIMEIVRPVLSNYGLTISHDGQAVLDATGAVAAVTVETRLIHESGQWVSNSVTMPLDKATAQGMGSALTYGRRYGLSALLALTTDEDDDGAAASVPGKAREQKPADEKVMPFGKTKGKKLGDLTDAELSSTIKWCRETDPKKFSDLIDAIGEVQADRMPEVTKESIAAAAEAEMAGLPF